MDHVFTSRLEFFLVLGVVFVCLLIVFVALVMWISSKQPKPEARGFEVKLNTGQSPVLREKENDHG
jgi:hypothetical protein